MTLKNSSNEEKNGGGIEEPALTYTSTLLVWSPAIPKTWFPIPYVKTI